MDTKQYIKVGHSLEKEFLVEAEHTAAHIGSGSLKVLSSPMMIAYIEVTARTLLESYLPAEYSTVGTRVDVRHLAPTKQGKMVRIHVEVVAVKDKKITLNVSAWDGEIKIGTGTHVRYLIDIDKFLEDLK